MSLFNISFNKIWTRPITEGSRNEVLDPIKIQLNKTGALPGDKQIRLVLEHCMKGDDTALALLKQLDNRFPLRLGAVVTDFLRMSEKTGPVEYIPPEVARIVWMHEVHTRDLSATGLRCMLQTENKLHFDTDSEQAAQFVLPFFRAAMEGSKTALHSLFHLSCSRFDHVSVAARSALNALTIIAETVDDRLDYYFSGISFCEKILNYTGDTLGIYKLRDTLLNEPVSDVEEGGPRLDPMEKNLDLDEVLEEVEGEDDNCRNESFKDPTPPEKKICDLSLIKFIFECDKQKFFFIDDWLLFRQKEIDLSV